MTVSSCSGICTKDQGNHDLKDLISLERFFASVFPHFAQKELGAFALFALCGYWNGPKKTGCWETGRHQIQALGFRVANVGRLRSSGFRILGFRVRVFVAGNR